MIGLPVVLIVMELYSPTLAVESSTIVTDVDVHLISLQSVSYTHLRAHET